MFCKIHNEPIFGKCETCDDPIARLVEVTIIAIFSFIQPLFPLPLMIMKKDRLKFIMSPYLGNVKLVMIQCACTSHQRHAIGIFETIQKEGTPFYIVKKDILKLINYY